MQLMLPLLNMQPSPQSSSKPQYHHHHQVMRTVSISILVMSLPVLYVSFLHVPPAALFRDTTFWFLMSNSIIIVIAADSGMLFFRSSSDADADHGGLPFVVSGGDPAAAVKNGHVSDEVAAVPVEVVVENQALVVTEQENQTVIAENDDHAYALVVREDQAEQVGSTPESKEIVLTPPSAIAGAGEGPRLTASRRLAREERTARRRHGHRSSHYSHALVPVQDTSVVVSEEKQLRRTATAAAEKDERASEYSRLSDEELNRRVEEFITRFNREIRLQLEMEQLALAAA